VHDLKEILQNLELLEDFEQGKLGCRFCKDLLKEDNFGALFVEGKDILASCAKPECLINLPDK